MSLVEDLALFVVLIIAAILVGTLKYDKDWWRKSWDIIDDRMERLQAVDPRLPTVVATALIILLFVYQDGLWSFTLWVMVTAAVTYRLISHVLLDLPIISTFVGDRWETLIRDQWVLPANVHETNTLSLPNRLLGVVPLPRRSILIMGSSGSGKTEMAKHLLYQTDFGDAPVVVFDRKDDYKEMFDEMDISYETVTMDGSSVIWNCFEEFKNEHDIEEFARSLYPEGSDFFDKSAPMVFAAVIKAIVRRNDGYEGLTNESLVNYFNKSEIEQIYEDLSEYEDLTGASSAINVDNAPKQAQGVYANIQQTINRVFVGDFEEAPGEDYNSFSMREYMNNPGSDVLVLDYPDRSGETTKPIFRFLIDQGAGFAMESDDPSYFILDEFAQIPHLREIETLLNVGRGRDVHVLSTLQSISQLNDNYGEDRGESMLAGHDTQMLLRANDPSTTDHVQRMTGTEWHEDSGMGLFGNYLKILSFPSMRQLEQSVEDAERESKRTEQHHFNQGEIQNWDAGEGVIVRFDGFIKGYVPMIDDVKHRYDAALNPDPSPWDEEPDQSGTHGPVADD